ncbi:hypothetical protein FN846DRAFT_977225, partial [Sphaerosporella brunnea]
SDPVATKKGPYTVQVPNAEQKEGHGVPRRHPLSIDQLATNSRPDVKTLYDVVTRGARLFGDAESRRGEKVKKMVDGEEREVPKKWFFYEMSGYTFKSFKQYKEQVDVCGAGLRQLGLGLRWLTMSHGCASQSMPIVTAYDTLGESGLMHSLNLISPLKEGTKIQYVIYTTEEPPNQKDLDTLKETHPHLKIANPVDPVLPDSEDLCCIMYTSGSTGTPKGVPLLHRNVIAASPHIGLVFENAIIVWGAAMGYGSPRTLADRAMRNCKGDIQELRPTVLVAVPAVWETVKKGIMDQVLSCPASSRRCWGAITLKSTLLQLGLPGVGKVKEATGGRMSNTPEQGEVWIEVTRCPSLYENEEATQAASRMAGSKTGDIGQRTDDRKKNPINYMALESLESNILVYADEKQTKPVAVIMPNENNLKNLAKAHKIPGDTLEELVHNRSSPPSVLQALLAQGQRV